MKIRHLLTGLAALVSSAIAQQGPINPDPCCPPASSITVTYNNVGHGGAREQTLPEILHDTQGNYNGAVVATSGSGKSFLLNEITSSVVGTGGRAWIIDVGRSYERTCKLLGGQFIEFTDASMININPFTHVHEMDTDEMSQLKRVVAQAIESTAEVSDLSMSWIEQAIREVWDAKGNDSTFSDIADVMLADDDQRIRDMGDALFPYTRAGAYGANVR